MAKDLTAALQALTEQAAGQTSRTDRSLPVARVPSEIPARSGASGPVVAPPSGSAMTPGAEQTITSSDGLFSFHFPAVLTMVDGIVTYTLGVMEKTP